MKGEYDPNMTWEMEYSNICCDPEEGKPRLNSLGHTELRACWTVNNSLGRGGVESIADGDDGSETSRYEAY